MSDTTQQESAKLDLARSLVGYLEAGDDDDAISVIAQLAGFRDSLLFQEVGRLARELHDSINGFLVDARLDQIASSEMPDAAERLKYVISMTEDAANTTLTAVEAGLPLADGLQSGAKHLAEQWERFNSRQLTVDEFRTLSNDLGSFLASTRENSATLHDKLSEVLMAQVYQDLTGQIIRRVIDLVGDVEGKLVELVRLSGARSDKLKDAAGLPRQRDITAQGPVVPGVDHIDSVSGQDDVDDLLSSLGF